MNNQINIEINAKTNVETAKKQLSKLREEIIGLQKPIKNAVKLQDLQYNKKLLTNQISHIENTKQLAFENQKLVKWINKGKQAQIGFNGAALSLLFFGMAIQKVTVGALTSIFETYKKLIPESNEFNKATTRLSANWEFFKFQLADAFVNSKIFQFLIQGAINLLKWVQQLSPEMKLLIVSLLGVGAALSGWLIISNTVRLGLASVIDQVGTLGVLTSGFSWGALAILGTLLVGAALSMEEFYTNTEIGKKKWELLTSALSTVLKNIVNPIIEGFQNIGININETKELMIVFGAVFHNVLVILGVGINALITILRTLFNILSIIIRTIKNTSEAISSLLVLDFDGATAAWRDWKNGITQDIRDIGEAFTNGVEAQKELTDSWVNAGDIDEMVTQFRQKNTLDSIASDKNGVVNNYIMIDGAAMSTILTDTEKQALQNLLGGGIVTSGGGLSPTI